MRPFQVPRPLLFDIEPEPVAYFSPTATDARTSLLGVTLPLNFKSKYQPPVESSSGSGNNVL
jgi:hypothetical protein